MIKQKSMNLNNNPLLLFIFLILITWTISCKNKIQTSENNTSVEISIDTLLNQNETESENLSLIPENGSGEETKSEETKVKSSTSTKANKSNPNAVMQEITKPDKPLPPTISLSDAQVEVMKKNNPKDEEKTVVITKPDHKTFDTLLKKYVSASGKVNYRGLKTDIGELEKYTLLLAENPVQKSWSKSESFAYWINAYNAYTLLLVVQNYPINSIKNLHNGKPWDAKWINIGDQRYSLNDIENNIIRPQYNDARIHFALNCAAKSCPPLANKAFTAQNLESLLESQTKTYLNSDAVKISATNLELTSIFDWYKVDFGDLITFIEKYTQKNIKKDAKITYSKYDWSLNN